MTNRLAHANSPYLIQHAENPVDWYPWGEEALARARTEQKPIFLSIGYSACHWCHVMAHESFENEAIAGLLNEHFVNVKVDREERPELDHVYMEAVQMMTGHGGWPLSVFLTPDLEPFFGGTYWPPASRGGMPGFDRVLLAVVDVWQNRRQQAVEQAAQLAQLIRDDSPPPGSEHREQLQTRPIEAAEAAWARSFDPHYGGFGSAPKFPQPIALRVLMRRWSHSGSDFAMKMVRTTLDRMARGGMYDHLGGGFHRYSVDARWLVPHFEKMLYDNAQLALCYLEAWQITGSDDCRRVVRETLDYLLRDMTSPEGAFYSTEDADSEGHEGKFYLWTPDEIQSVLGPERASVFARVYDVTSQGNFEGQSILNLPKPIDAWAADFGLAVEQLRFQLTEDRAALLARRAGRVRPARDDKILTAWNGLAIEAFALAGAALGEERYRQAAVRAAEFLLEHLRDGEGRLLHAWRQGRAGVPAFLDDYAALAGALVTLYETGFDERWIDHAVTLVDEILARFADDRGGFFYSAAGQADLIARRKDVFDASVPSSSGLAATALVRLGKLCGRSDYLEAAEQALLATTPWMERAPTATGQMLLALDMLLTHPREIVILGTGGEPSTDLVLAEIHRRFVPNKVVAYRDASDGAGAGYQSPALSGIFQGKSAVEPGPTVYICENFTCGAPRTGKADALSALASLS